MARGRHRDVEQDDAPVPEGSGSLPDVHRFAFLQAVIERKWMPESEAKLLFRELANLAGDNASYVETISEINDGLISLLMEIRSVKLPLCIVRNEGDDYMKQGKLQVDKTRYIGFVNKKNDQIARDNGSLLTVQQIHYLRAVITAIAIDEEALNGVGSLSAIQCGHIRASNDMLSQATQGTLTQQAKQLTLSQKSDALDMFVRDGWLAETPGRRGYYSLGSFLRAAKFIANADIKAVRTFLELHSLLLSLPVTTDTRANWETFL